MFSSLFVIALLSLAVLWLLPVPVVPLLFRVLGMIHLGWFERKGLFWILLVYATALSIWIILVVLGTDASWEKKAATGMVCGGPLTVAWLIRVGWHRFLKHRNRLPGRRR